MSGNPPLILALDIATKTGVCEGRVGEAPRFYSLRFARDGEDHEEAFARALRWIVERFQVDRPDAVCVEAPVNPAPIMGRVDPETGRLGLSTNPDTTIRLMGLWAVLAAAAKVKGVRYFRVHVQTARKAFVGAGNLKGPEGKRRSFEMCKAIGWGPNNRDESDAGCVFYWAACQLAPNLAPVITPMLQHRVATTIGGVDIGDANSLFKTKAVARAR